MPNSTRSFRRACLVAAAAVLVATVPFPTNAQVAESTYVNTNQLVAGMYPPNQWSSTENIRQMSLASGKPLSLAGLWLNASESPDNVIHQLEQVWAAGATPFVNINVDWPPLRIIGGFIDAEIANFGKGVGRWLAMGEGRAVLLAPMPEMNGDWVPYGMDPANFEEAYRHFVSLATQNGASGRVRWVFAPNGWSTPPHRMVDYYPGPEMVDLVGFSAYNWGTVSGTRWATVPETMCVALNEARGFAREKPFLITQTASATTGGDRSAWIGRMFEFLVDDPNAVGFLYFNIDKERDWAIGDDAVLPAGWRQGMQSPTTSYQFPLESWFAPGPLVVDTVAQMYPGCIADIERSQFQPEIEWLLASGITVGCAESRFCPTSPVTRQQMATFLVRALGLATSPADIFTDDNGSAHELDINALAQAGITAGCAPGSFCPTATTTRAQMATFLTRGFGLAPSTTDSFIDDQDSVHQADINAAALAGVTQGCGGSNFCPDRTVTREQMAAFLRRAMQ